MRYISVGLLLAADVWLVCWPESDYYAGIWLLLGLAGIFGAGVAWISPRVGLIAGAVGALHCAVFVLAAHIDQRTFFGGKMILVIAAYLAALATVLIYIGACLSVFFRGVQRGRG